MPPTPFEHVVRAHGARVLRVCRGMLGPDASGGVDADDAWSETFLKALRAWPDLPDDLDPEAWLVTVARRTCLDVLRARTRRRTDPVAVPPEPTTHVGDHPGSRDVDDAGVWAHVAALPPKQRAVVTYRYLGGLDYERIAALVGGTPTAARRAAADGLTTLRRKEIR